jgi:hypothetical protein
MQEVYWDVCPKTQGSEGPLQDKHDGQVVFGNHKSCTYFLTRWVEPYVGGGKYDVGGVDVTSTSPKTKVPCP